MQHKREIPEIVNKNIVIKFCNFHTLGGGTSLVMALGNRKETDLHALNNFSTLIVKVSFKTRRNSHYYPGWCTLKIPRLKIPR